MGRNIEKCKFSHNSLVVFKTVLGERRNMHTPMHCPLHYSNPILPGVGHMKNWSSKTDIFLNFMLKTFEIQTFFGYNPLLGSSLAHIKKILCFIHCLLCLSTHFRR